MDLGILDGGYGVFRPDAVVVRPDRMLRLHGYRDLGKVRPVIVRTAEEVAKRAEELFTPEVHYKRLPVDDVTGEGRLQAGGLAFHNPAFTKYLRGAREVTVVVATMGKALDDEVIAVMEEFDPLRALFLETAGWLGIETTTKHFATALAESVRGAGYRLTQRLGPGYSYKVDGEDKRWPLEEQQQLFRAFEDVELPVRLLDQSCAMMPKMSRSGLYGLTPLN